MSDNDGAQRTTPAVESRPQSRISDSTDATGASGSKGTNIDDVEQLLESIRDLPPSAKLVLKVVAYEGGLTKKGLVKETRLQERTVRSAVDSLLETGVVSESRSPFDARQSIVSLEAAGCLPAPFLPESASESGSDTASQNPPNSQNSGGSQP